MKLKNQKNPSKKGAKPLVTKKKTLNKSARKKTKTNQQKTAPKNLGVRKKSLQKSK